MTETISTTVSRLRQADDGDRAAADKLFAEMYDTLRSVARAYMRNERIGHTLQATAVVNEAYMRLVGGAANLGVKDRAAFFQLAAYVMRHVLVDHARDAKAQKRNGGRAVTLREWMSVLDEDLAVRLDAEAALRRLKELDPRQEQILSLYIYAGRTPTEIAGLIGVSRRTVQRQINSALALLRHEARA